MLNKDGVTFANSDGGFEVSGCDIDSSCFDWFFSEFAVDLLDHLWALIVDGDFFIFFSGVFDVFFQKLLVEHFKGSLFSAQGVDLLLELVVVGMGWHVTWNKEGAQIVVDLLVRTISDYLYDVETTQNRVW